jgi:hypothetical protein
VSLCYNGIVMNIDENKKRKLFNICKKDNLFWSYRKDIRVEEMADEIIIEKILRYGDIDALVLLFKTYPYTLLYNVWTKALLPDERFEQENHFLAKFFFEKDIRKIKVETRMDRIINFMKTSAS